ncbi:MAG TPA: hypothetical protein VJC16_05445 [Candidatus Nanoarchaeia archaeon]|nr:hypothetical protein [Candidatus Nanoarchaeia archaeon]
MSSWQRFISSFRRLGRDYLKMIGWDIAAYAGISGLLALLQGWITGQLAALNALQAGALSNIDIVENSLEAQQYAGAISSFIIKSAIILLVFSLSVLVIWSLCKGMVYSILLKKPFTVKGFFRFAGLNAIWGIFWLALIVLAMRLLAPGAAAVLLGILAILWLYLTFFLYYSFTLHQSIRKAFTQLLPLGIGKLPHLFFPYLLSLLTFIALLIIGLLLNLLPEQFSLIISPLLLIAYIAWLRIYLAGILHETHKDHTTK